MKKLLFALLFCVGCVGPVPEGLPTHEIQLRIENGPKSPSGHSISEFISYISAGAAIWSEVGGVLTLDDHAPLLIECSTEPLGDIIAVTTAGGVTADCDWLDQIDDNRYRIHVFAHELGHVWGLMHVPEQKAIMYGGVNSAVSLQADDLVEWYRVYPQE